jgi:hypothetical protein
MNPNIVIGVISGASAVVFATVVTVWAIKITRRGMYGSANSGISVLSKSELKNNLLRLNLPQHPFRLFESSDADLEIEWPVSDAKWIEVLGPGFDKLTSRAWILLDDALRTVPYREQLWETMSTGGGGGTFAIAAYQEAWSLGDEGSHVVGECVPISASVRSRPTISPRLT